MLLSYADTQIVKHQRSMETTFHPTGAAVACLATLELRRVNPCNVGQPHCPLQHPEEEKWKGVLISLISRERTIENGSELH